MAEASSGVGKGAGAFRTIGEVSDEIGVPQHVLRFWETKFPAIKPLKRGGNRRYYRPEDVELIRAINRLLYTDGYTIRGVQKLVAERGTGAVIAAPPEPTAPAPTDRLSQLRAIRDRLAAGLAEARAA